MKVQVAISVVILILMSMGAPMAEDWRKEGVRPGSAPGRVVALARGGGTWVGVGTNGTIVRRAEGGAWEDHSWNEAIPLHDVLWTGETFLAVGGGAVISSSDAVHWSRIATTQNELRAVVQVSELDGGLLVGVGAHGAVAHSSDGSSWSFIDPVGTSTFVDIAWSGSRLVAITGDGTAAVSEDAASWTTHQVVDDSLSGLASYGGGFAVVGGSVFSRILASPDGIDWTSVLEGAGGRDWMNAIAAGGDGYVAGGAIFADLIYPWVTASSNGSDWTSESLLTSDEVGDVEAVGSGEGRWLLTTSDGSFFGRGSASGVERRFAIASYLPGEAFEVRLESLLEGGGWIVTERVPAGWSVIDAGGGAVLADGTVQFSGDALSIGTIATYSILPPADTWGTAVFDGIVDLDGLLGTVLGDDRIEDRANANARELATVWWLPIAAHLDGSFGSVWRSDLTLTNLGPETIDVALRVTLPDGSTRAVTNRLAGGAQGVWSDLLGNSFPGVDKAPVEIRTNGPISGMGRLYNLATDFATQGQAMPIVRSSQGLGYAPYGTPKPIALLQHLRQQTDAWRSNLLFLNTSRWEAVVRTSLQTTLGAEITSFEVTLQPGQAIQEIQPFARRGNRPDIGWAQATVSLRSGEGVLVSASVIDSASNDPTTIEPVILRSDCISAFSSWCSNFEAAGTIEVTDCVDSPAGLGHHSASMTFEATSAQHVEIAAEHSFGFGRLYIADPNGVLLASNEVDDSWGSTALSADLVEDGWHTVWLTAANQGELGDWAMSIACSSP